MKGIFYKFISLFSVIRLYNIFIIIIAQYFTSIFIVSIDNTISSVIFDSQLFLLIISSSIAIASGYIINNFYDYEKDLINKPLKSRIDRVVRKRTKLKLYIILNFLCVNLLFSFLEVCPFFLYVYFSNLVLFTQTKKKIDYWKHCIISSFGNSFSSNINLL